MLPTGNRTGSVKMMSIRTGKLVTRDQFKLLPMPSTVITRLNEMAASEGRKIGTRTNMVYSTDRGSQNVTYMRPTTEPLTESPAELTDENAIDRLADNDVGFQADDVAPQQELYSAEGIVNDVRTMDAQFVNDHPSQRRIELSADDLDVGPLVDFYEPVAETYRHPDAAVPVTPPRSGGDRELRSSVRKSAVQADIAPLRRNLLNYY